ncbi:hypothetical protein OIU85_007623 [Salix viminalis]|uniref:CASP-like protein n=1 Tax=Salix viminalis TaxID=40686 RepID=A0A9Q0P9B6_SALVM|nr:hypothetical protein OIU85_007623 [Salix viminalis]
MGDVEIPALVKQIVRGLRGSAFLATVLATSFMAASHEKAIFPFDYKADYADLMLFKAFLGSNIAASLYSFFFVCLPPKSLLWRLAIVLDVIMFGILVAMDSAAMAAAYLHKNGDSQALWPPICSQVPSYCYRVILAISMGFGGVFMFLLIIIFSISAILNPLILV